MTTCPSTRIKISSTGHEEFSKLTEPVTLKEELSIKLTLLKFGVPPPIKRVVVAGVKRCVPNAGVTM